ncbi:hypothetical protein GCM10009616_40140 [Microlunatus lacustris]
MTTILDASTPAGTAPRRNPSPVTVVVDHPELTALLRAGLPPAALPCGRSEVQQGHHCTGATCPDFVRPQLPAGFGYADQLIVGQEFGFLSTTEPAPLRRLVGARCCAAGTLTVLTAVAADGLATTHWVDGSLVVRSRS